MTQISGTIKLIKATEQVSEKFAKRNFVVTTNEMYPQDVQMQMTQDKCDVLNGYSENDQVTVDINIRGREWVNPEGKSIYFVTLEAWKIEKHVEQAHENKESTPESIPASDPGEADDDLPF